MLSINKLVFLAAVALSVVAATSSDRADVLYKKQAPVSIGFGTTAKTSVEWMPCSRAKKEKYAKPPFWVSKGDNCELRASDFGLSPFGGRYIVTDIQKASELFPDVKRGDAVEYQNDRARGLIRLTLGTTWLLLPYSAPPTSEQQTWNAVSVAAGLTRAGKTAAANELLGDVRADIESAEPRFYPTEFITGISAQLFRIKAASPTLSPTAHASLLRLAYLQTTLEAEPQIPDRNDYRGCDPIAGQNINFSNNVYRFGEGNPCGLSAAPSQSEKTLGIYISNSFVEGGTHTLDGIVWDHDTFVRSRIQYHGGLVSLTKILFVDCTFQILDTPQGDQVINFAISRVPHLSIPEEAGFNHTNVPQAASLLPSFFLF